MNDCERCAKRDATVLYRHKTKASIKRCDACNDKVFQRTMKDHGYTPVSFSAVDVNANSEEGK